MRSQSIAIVAALAALTLSHTLAWHVGETQGQAQGQKQVAALTASYAEAARQAEAQAQTQLQSAQAHVAEVSASLAETRAELETTQTQLKRNIVNVTKQYRPAPGAALVPLPDDVFSNGFIGLYNSATTAGGQGAVPQTDDPARTVDQTNATANIDARLRDPLALSGVSPADLLAHHVDYATWCGQTSVQLDALIDVVKKLTEEHQ